MKQFLYLDTDIVNSIIAQSEKGIITGFSTEEENGEQKSTNKSISGNLEGDAGGKLLKVFNAELKLDIRGGIGTEKEVHSASREIITKTLHDAAFDIAYDSISISNQKAMVNRKSMRSARKPRKKRRLKPENRQSAPRILPEGYLSR